MSDDIKGQAEGQNPRIEIPGFCYSLVDHCNLACHGCDHDSPLAPPRFTAADEFHRDLRALSKVLHARDLRLGGGEPLLHPKIERFFEIARESGVADRLTLVTNGLLLDQVAPRIWTLIDGIYLSVYPDVVLPKPVSAYATIAVGHGVHFDAADQSRFLHTLLNQKIEDGALVEEVYRRCKMTGEWWCHTVHEGRYYKCSIAPFCMRRMARLGVEYRPEEDSIGLRESPNLRAELARFLGRREPLAACVCCLGTSGLEEAHRVMDRRAVEAWWKEDHSAAIAEARVRLLGSANSSGIVTGGPTSASLSASPHARRTSRPRISVIIPCFNLGEYLDEAVQSVLAQTVQDFEILVVDDGSTDPGTVSRLEALDYPKTTEWRTPNRGLAAARNFLIGHASGEFLCALDADDRLRPEYFARALEQFDRDPGLTFVSAWLQEFGIQNGVWRQERCDLPALLAEDTVMTAALVRRQAVVDLGGYDEQMPVQGDEDWDLWIRIVKAGGRGMILPEILFEYRRRPGSMSTICTAGQSHLDLVRYLFRKHEDAYREHLRDVLLWQDRRTARALRDNDMQERLRDGDLRADLELARTERDRLARRVDDIAVRGAGARVRHMSVTTASEDPERLAAGLASKVNDLTLQLNALHEEYLRSREEIRVLRRSVSWRLTWPMRRLYEAMLGTSRRAPS